MLTERPHRHAMTPADDPSTARPDTVVIDRDILEWALASVGGDDECEFEPVHAGDPDHHGKEFAAALFDAIVREIEEFKALGGRWPR